MMNSRLRWPWPELALVLSGFALRLQGLESQGFWWDEAFSVQLARHDWSTFWTLLADDRSPPLFPLLLRGWGSLAGWSEFAARMLPLSLGVLTLPLVYRLARHIGGRTAGLTALTLAAASPALIAYSQELRMYALLVAATAAFWLAVEHSLASAGKSQLPVVGWATLLIGEIALLFSHYYGAAAVGAANLIVLAEHAIRRRPTAELRGWLAAQLVALALFAAWLGAFLDPQSSVRGAAERAPDWGSFLHQVVVLWAAGVRDLDYRQATLWALATVWLTLTLVLPTFILWRSQHWDRAARLSAFALLAIGLAFALAVWQVSFHPRYTLPLLVPLIVLCAAALATPGSGRAWTAVGRAVLASAAVATWLVGWGVAREPAYAKDDLRGVSAYLQANARAGEVILVEDNDYTMAYYYRGPAKVEMVTEREDAATIRQLASATQDAEGVWTVHWHISQQDARGLWPYTLERSGILLERKTFRGYTLSHYQREVPLSGPAWRAAAVSFEKVELTGLDLASRAEGGDALGLALEWQATAPTEVALRAVAGLWDRSGQRWTASDATLLDPLGRTSDAWVPGQAAAHYLILPVPAGLPPGEYLVTIGVYEANTLRRVPTRAGYEDAPLGYVQVERMLGPDADPYGVLANLGLRSPQEPLSVDGLQLEGIAVWPAQPAPAQSIRVILRWRATAEGLPAHRPVVQLRSSRVWAVHELPLFEPDYPTTRWRVGEAILDSRALIYPPRREPIVLEVRIGDRSATAATLMPDLSQLSFEPPAAAERVRARFGDFAELIGYALSSDRLQAGRPLTLTLYWRATNMDRIPTRHTVFAQALAPDGHLVAQHDGPPNFNRRPTPAWVPGEIIADPHPLAIVDPNYQGPATLIVGLYDSDTLIRVPLRGGGDAFSLPTSILIEGP
ncbi:MAG: glycosyltransferase family 39 protein [Chloroflexi bacterium]|nr:glycosyltransferase family 39 protein [Chloroflexota bacterium]